MTDEFGKEEAPFASASMFSNTRTIGMVPAALTLGALKPTERDDPLRGRFCAVF